MKGLVLGGATLLAGTVLLGQAGRLGVDRPVFLLGLALAGLGYLLGLLFLHRESRRSPGSSIGRWGWMILGGITLLARLSVLPMPASDDVYRYLWEGRLQSLGGNPYVVAPANADAFLPEGSRVDAYRTRVNHPELTTIYPPLAELVFRLGALLSYELVAWKALMAAFDLFVAALLILFLRATGRPAREVLAYVWHPLPIVCFAGEGHVDVLLLLTTWGTFLLLARGRRGLAGAAWGGAVASKFLPAIYLPLLLRPLGWRGLAAAAAVLVSLTLPFAGAGVGIVRTLFLFGRQMRYNAPLHAGLAALLGDGAIQLLVGGVFLAGALFVVMRNRDGAGLPDGAFGLTALVLLLAPTVHPWYLTWLVPFFVRGRSPAWVTWSLTVGLGFLAYGFEAETGRFGLPGPWLAVEYVPFYSLLVLGGWARRRPRVVVSAAPVS